LVQLQLDRLDRAIDHGVSVLQHFLGRKMQDLQMTVDRFGHAMDRFRLQLVATRQYVERNEHIVRTRFETALLRAKEGIRQLARVFANFDVQKTLNRGFAIVRQGDRIVKDPANLDQTAQLNVQLAKGTLLWPQKKK